ncbi:hypothetical protein AM493_18155 [Flavobacterium akiainvivens]|uniref:DUF5723 domain-containing protein n=1 Tax=Flavobacterium akiainvivens TaxID=1202724 RepID=A0A0M8ML39_9FLAO|nr:hypothetical protein [Flavobacterium akiainvivens]KOS07758.1 hypothetical protein AM493_18155 [Flavobacterium akiainvivens]SFQ25732.1 hypothetical protein SAMN05444144_102212 [Flavobacterium akiainvivens]
MKHLLILLFSITAFAQQADTLQTRFFSLTPTPRRIDRVNGLAIGFGGSLSNTPTMFNGVNIEVNPLTPLILIFLDPAKILVADNEKVMRTVNGLHLAAGGFMDGDDFNGLGISVFSITNKTNGLTISALYNVSRQLHGVHISGLSNSAHIEGSGLFIAALNNGKKFSGVQIGGFNTAEYFKGVSIGIANTCTGEMNGLQIGLINKAKKCNGLQIGLLNQNDRGTMPFINW